MNLGGSNVWSGAKVALHKPNQSLEQSGSTDCNDLANCWLRDYRPFA